MQHHSYNLARKWRPKTLHEIVGQELTVRIVKNSLYRQQFFPVYLLSGQRGCGKTTVGRLFAAAVNCAALDAFSADPQKIILPCLTCTSCTAYMAGQHPDIIEIDAASYTGVDNVRQIIEAASLLPVMGRKKVYLIDEAHMLSKAAFNAFLKILEEPAPHLLFMLATTEPHKIIDTVRSRCFQLFFNPLPLDVLVTHLHNVCTAESITCESEALRFIACEGEGSVRDALNYIERIYVAEGAVTVAALQGAVGQQHNELLFRLFEYIIAGNTEQVMRLYTQEILIAWSPEFLWKKINEFIRACVWAYHGHAAGMYQDQFVRLQELVSRSSLVHLLFYMELLYIHETLFIKTMAQHALLEIVFLQMALGPARTVVKPAASHNRPSIARDDKSTVGSTAALTRAAAPAHRSAQTVHASAEKKETSVPGVSTHEQYISPTPPVAMHTQPAREVAEWSLFLQKHEKTLDPVVFSVLKQANIAHAADQVRISISHDLLFFKDMVEAQRPVLQQLMEEMFGKKTTLVLEWDVAATVQSQGRRGNERVTEERSNNSRSEQMRRTVSRGGVTHNSDGLLTDSAQVQAVLRIFPGTITEMKEENT